MLLDAYKLIAAVQVGIKLHSFRLRLLAKAVIFNQKPINRLDSLTGATVSHD